MSVSDARSLLVDSKKTVCPPTDWDPYPVETCPGAAAAPSDDPETMDVVPPERAYRSTSPMSEVGSPVGIVGRQARAGGHHDKVAGLVCAVEADVHVVGTAARSRSREQLGRATGALVDVGDTVRIPCNERIVRFEEDAAAITRGISEDRRRGSSALPPGAGAETSLVTPFTRS